MKKEDSINKLNEIRKDIKDAYSKGKLTEQHYNLLNDEISQLEKDTEK
ncbi:MAG: hypothetical protein M3162_07355 [Thermoproteota archaeon]|nr:hypothetical protein [Thermoproteota archaeon]